MSIIAGVEELVDPPHVFDVRATTYMDVITHGVRNFFDRMTLTVVGAAVLAAASVPTPAPAPHLGARTFIEPADIVDDGQQWQSSVDRLRKRVADMSTGQRPAHSEALAVLANETLESVKGRSAEDVSRWANALASEDDDLRD